MAVFTARWPIHKAAYLKGGGIRKLQADKFTHFTSDGLVFVRIYRAIEGQQYAEAGRRRLVLSGAVHTVPTA